jgi:hypothetical protein
MADPLRRPEADEGADARPGRGGPNGAPRWVVVVGIIVAIALLVLIVVLHLTGAIGPGAH